MDSRSFFDVATTVERIGRYQWLEQRLFELMGSLASKLDDPDVTFLLGSQSFHHEFLAGRWSGRLSQLGGDGSEVRPPSDVVDSTLSAKLWEHQAAGSCLVGLYRTVLPRLAGIYDSHLASLDVMTSGATARVLVLAGNDYRADWIAGEFFTQKFFSTDEAIADALRFQSDVEQALGAGPGLV